MTMSSMLQGHITFLLQKQLIEQLSGLSDSTSLTEALLQRHRKSGREIAAEAITGRIRSDAGVLRQSARNLREGGDMAEIARTGVASIVESLKKMHDLALNAPADGVDTNAYRAHVESIQNVIRSTSYNGISLLSRFQYRKDGNNWLEQPQWGVDERVSLNNTTPATGSINIQAGNGTRTVTLTDFSGMNLPDFDDPSLATKLSELISTMKMHERSYGQLASSMASEAKSIERQSRILDLSATRTISGAGTDPASRLLFFLLSEQGKLIDNKS